MKHERDSENVRKLFEVKAVSEAEILAAAQLPKATDADPPAYRALVAALEARVLHIPVGTSPGWFDGIRSKINAARYEIGKQRCDEGVFDAAVLALSSDLTTEQLNEAAKAVLHSGERLLEMQYGTSNRHQQLRLRVAELAASIAQKDGIAPEIKAQAEEVSKRINPIGSRFAIKAVGLNGEVIELAALHGRVVVVDFWATWCSPCRMQTSVLMSAYEQFRSSGLEIIGISSDDVQALRTYTEKNKLPWAQIAEGEERSLSKRFGIHGIPTLLFIDKTGTVRGRQTGYMRPNDFVEQIGKLLRE